jgi:hypothetical protein
MRLSYSVPLFVGGLLLFLSHPANPQSPKETYSRITETPSGVHWCLPEAGDDPAGIIGQRCEVYSDCLETAGMTEAVDQKPFPFLSDEQRLNLKKCHQALYNAARVNPQIKGSKATQDWLEHGVLQGGEAKPLPAPGSPH